MIRKVLLAALALSAAIPASAQLPPPSAGRIVMGHHHFNVSDVEAQKHFWVDLLGAEAISLGKMTVIKVPNGLIALTPKAPTGGSRGTTINHVGFQVPDVKATVAKLKAAGVPIVTKQEVAGGRATDDVFYTQTQDTFLAFVLAPDDIKVELMQNPKVDGPIVNHHTHFAAPDVPAMQKWYADMFGAKPMVRGQFQAADLPGVNLTFSPAVGGEVGTKGRAIDHTGFEVRGLEQFCKELEAKGVKFDIPFREVPALGLKIAFLTDPWGTYLELTEGLDKL
ncbi:MAG: VOC family protein [Bryobacterales bacterium]|nr:VOC family protein [Bryobacterales bacterium]